MTTTLRNRKRMNRFETISRLTAKLDDRDAVIGGIGNTNFDLWAAAQRPCNFYMLGSMGLAFPIALGVALAQPNRRVIALDGDGSLLMELGCLATIAAVAPKNLTMVLFDNGMYQITGGQKTVTSGVTDLVAIAQGAGLSDAKWANDEDDFDRLFAEAIATEGPSFIGVTTDTEKARGTTDRDPVRIRVNFSDAMAR